MTTNRPKTGPTSNIILEDSHLLVADKKAGVATLASHGGIASLAEELADKRPELKKVGGNDHGIVHRLDNDTSGLVLVAKDDETYEALREDFSSGKVTKKYIALVLGEIEPKLTIETPIVHDPNSAKKMKIVQGASPKAQAAVTKVSRLKLYSGGKYSLVEVEISTGVRHQIRVHLASIGHPLAGDKLYQNLRQRKRDDTKLSRHFLHASFLAFLHPVTKKHISVKSKLPKELDKVLSSL